MAAPAARAAAQTAPQPGGRRAVDVLEVTGRLDRIQADFIARSIREAERAVDEVVVIQLDSAGDLLDAAELDALAFRVSHSSVPVAVWVGPSGSRAYGGATVLLRSAAVGGMAQGTRTGRFPGGPPGDPLSTSRALSAETALAQKAVDVVTPTLGEFVVGLDGVEVGGRKLSTARVVPAGSELRRQAAGDVRFAQLGLVERVLHATARPSVAYLLLVVALLLIVFEFFTAGIGLAGLTGALALVLSSYGLAALPTRGVGLALVGIGVLGLAVDVQAGAPRSWTVIGTVALVVGSWQLFPGDLAVPWLTIVPVVAGAVLVMVAGMASMLRARFSTPTIGREAMIGRMGEATTGIAPEGTVLLDGATWRARTNRATPIPSGEPVRVVAIDGLILEVEPEVGGARDAGH
jgi:membrane-bound serine protease (ClpP class)